MNKQYSYSQHFTKVFAKGDRFIVHGWIMLKGVEEAEYEVTESGENSVQFKRILKSGKLSAKTLHFLRSDLFGCLNCYICGDLNGIQLTKSANVEIIEKVKQN